MDLSIRWLKDYVDIGDISMRDFSEAMSMSGSKVEGWTTEFEDVKKCSGRKDSVGGATPGF